VRMFVSAQSSSTSMGPPDVHLGRSRPCGLQTSSTSLSCSTPAPCNSLPHAAVSPAASLGTRPCVPMSSARAAATEASDGATLRAGASQCSKYLPRVVSSSPLSLSHLSHLSRISLSFLSLSCSVITCCHDVATNVPQRATYGFRLIALCMALCGGGVDGVCNEEGPCPDLPEKTLYDQTPQRPSVQRRPPFVVCVENDPSGKNRGSQLDCHGIARCNETTRCKCSGLGDTGGGDDKGGEVAEGGGRGRGGGRCCPGRGGGARRELAAWGGDAESGIAADSREGGEGGVWLCRS